MRASCSASCATAAGLHAAACPPSRTCVEPQARTARPLGGTEAEAAALDLPGSQGTWPAAALLPGIPSQRGERQKWQCLRRGSPAARSRERRTQLRLPRTSFNTLQQLPAPFESGPHSTGRCSHNEIGSCPKERQALGSAHPLPPPSLCSDSQNLPSHSSLSLGSSELPLLQALPSAECIRPPQLGKGKVRTALQPP
ncbi:hypothetical protein KIL84_003092 [Mauremys mutica]|uniref:Uncharacterized protein n=1 Tax=Mauremys mutica TaxID=74926 RepID=A0A9D4AR29_9SAUR|nr:hypothetical protein KIL84_003092 [Mauremys mutica]